MGLQDCAFCCSNAVTQFVCVRRECLLWKASTPATRRGNGQQKLRCGYLSITAGAYSVRYHRSAGAYAVGYYSRCCTRLSCIACTPCCCSVLAAKLPHREVGLTPKPAALIVTCICTLTIVDGLAAPGVMPYKVCFEGGGLAFADRHSVDGVNDQPAGATAAPHTGLVATGLNTCCTANSAYPRQVSGVKVCTGACHHPVWAADVLIHGSALSGQSQIGRHRCSTSGSSSCPWLDLLTLNPCA
jgi:hypothetical protein